MLKIQGINFSYGKDQFALENVSFEIKNGQILGLIGRNGAGKTTILNVISGLLEKNSGQILIDGKEMNFLKRSQELSFLPIDFQLYDYLTLDENLIFVCKMRNLTPNEKEIENVFLDYDLQAYRYQQLASLSTGLKQKFYFLIAIIHNPKILILDEPFTGLDPKQIIYFKER